MSKTVKMYTPKGAILAMLNGDILSDVNGNFYFFDDINSEFGFAKKMKAGEPYYPVEKFTGLFKEIKPKRINHVGKKRVNKKEPK